MKGWFDAFRDEGGPTLYAYHNRTPVAADVPAVALCAAAITLYVAFLAVFPGIRKERFSTFATVTLSLFVGTVILVCKHGSSWHVAAARVSRASYRAFSSERLAVRIGAHVGLDHVNVTLRSISTGNVSAMSDVDYNERFPWSESGGAAEAYRAALRRGLPYPLLTVAEYFALAQEGFDWGARYRAAGYCAATLLWASLALWCLSNLLLVVVPRYGAYLLVVTGAALASTAAGYWCLLPRAPLVITLEGATLHFALGWCFWLVLISGCICCACGLAVSALDVAYPHRFTTVLEVDFDTPHDRHVLIVASHAQRPNSRMPSLPARILRRLSSKTREMESNAAGGAGIAGAPGVAGGRARLSSGAAGVGGRDNVAFQAERAPPPAPKSPWRYPLFRRPLPHPMDRNDSASSFGSMTGAMKMSPLAAPSPAPVPNPAHHIPPHRLRPQIPATERLKDMW